MLQDINKGHTDVATQKFFGNSYGNHNKLYSFMRSVVRI